MDFFSQQDAARRKTGLLVCYFALAVLLMIVALYVVAVAITPGAEGSQGAGQAGEFRWFQPETLLITALLVGSVVGLGSAYKILELRGGGEQVANMVGGRRISPHATDPGERRLLNVVEEMAVASGIPVPPVYVLEGERSINAFAAGYSPGDAVIGVSRGALEYLSRDELQGVVAHEFSHILHGDMRLNIRLIGVLHGILLVAVIGYYLLRVGAYSGATRSRNRKDSGGAYLLILGLAALVIGSIGLFFARLIKAAVSRQREFLADASAVQYTRNPDGIGGALKKIGGLSGGSKLEAAETETVSHMLFANGRGSSLLGMLATHPPLVERIRRIDPAFDGQFPKVQAQPTAEPVAAGKPPAQRPRIGTPLGRTPIGRGIPLDPTLLLGAIGSLGQGGVAYAHQLIESLPKRLSEALHDAFSARCAVFALLLEPEGEIRVQQLRLLGEQEGEPSVQETLALEPLIVAQGRSARLPIIEVVQASLVGLSPEQYERFHQSVDRLVQADRKISLFEFVVQQVLMDRLSRHILNHQPPSVKYHALNGVRQEVVGLISCVAHLGSADPVEAGRAFGRAVSDLFAPGPGVQVLPKSECSMRTVQQSLHKLAQSSPSIKKRVLAAAATCVIADGRVTVEEAELLRAIADSLDCPLPPISATHGESGPAG